MDKKLNQQLDKKLQESYEQLSAKAPKGLWQRLQMHLPEVDLDEQLDDKVQSSYEQLTVTAPAGLWEQLEQALPTAKVDELLDEKLKEGFAQQAAQTAPRALWSAISEELGTAASIDEQLDDKVKSSYKEEQLRAPHKVWTAVNRQLNIDRTWQKISSALDSPVVAIDWKLRSLKGIVLALLLLLWVRTCDKIPTVTTQQPQPIAVTTSQENNTSTTNPQEKVEQEGMHVDEAATILENTTSLVEQEPSLPKENGTAFSKKEKAIANPAEQNNQFSLPNHKKIVSQLPAVVLNSKNNNRAENQEATPKVTANLLQPTNKKVEGNVANKESNKTGALPLNGWLSKVPFQKGNTRELLVLEGSRTSVNKPTATPARTLAGTTETLETKSLAALTLPSFILPEELELANEPTWKNKHWSPKNRLAVGVFTAVNSTVLLNNETREGFDYNSLIINYFGLAANYGLWARYRLGKRGALMAEYSLNADHRQAYGIYQKGKFIVKEYVFKYNRISLAYQYDLWKDAGHPGNKVTAQLGAYVGLMRGAQLYYNKVLVNDNVSEYHHYDGGLKVALGHEVAIDHFVIGYGIRSDIGVANIFKGNQKLDGQQDRTNLIHLGGYIHLGYQF